MGIYEKLLGQEPFPETLLNEYSTGRLMLMGILVFSSNIIFEDEMTDVKKREGETFELMILSTLFLLKKFKDIKPYDYSSFEEDMLGQIYNFAKGESILEKLPCDFTNFINARFVLYHNDYLNSNSEEVKLPFYTTYNLSVNPLELESSACEDFYKVGVMQIRLNIYFERLNESFDFIISKKYS